MFKNKAAEISQVLTNYFEGIYTGNIEQLRSSFHPNAFLYGDVKGVEYQKSLADYLEGVQSRKSPSDLGEANRMEIISLEILGEVAVAKLSVPMLGYRYCDFLSLAVVNGEWKMVNKIFTHVE